MRSRRVFAAAAALTAAALLASGCGRSLSSASAAAGGTTAALSPTANLSATTTAGTAPVSQVTWAVYRDVNSLDPAFAFDYPENTAISLMCESLLRQQPSGAVTSGLATVTAPDDTTYVFTVKPGATFWDGHPVTAADVVYSLDRQRSAAIGGFYGGVFDRVTSITATGGEQVTVKLSAPDTWLEGELSSMAGIVIEKAFAVKAGKNYGTPTGGIMCTGAYQYQS